MNQELYQDLSKQSNCKVSKQRSTAKKRLWEEKQSTQMVVTWPL